MSTPRTDAACGWPWGHHGRIECGDLRWSSDGPFVHSEVARELERELNVANNWVEHHQNHCDDLIKENARLRMELDASCNAEEMRQVRAENAALRADRDRLDFLESTTGSYWASLLLAEGKWLTRKEIDRRMATEPKP